MGTQILYILSVDNDQLVVVRYTLLLDVNKISKVRIIVPLGHAVLTINNRIPMVQMLPEEGLLRFIFSWRRASEFFFSISSRPSPRSLMVVH